ncbi:alpha/beta hydrolase [Streptomyces griseoviridis]|uniref:alpha/beta hydrolase n=1 Tax=Streptomyces griseoviridis TaxID=45398 RepID=UPI0033C53C21
MTEYTDHHGPHGLRVRGTVVVVPGRGETRATYTRFGRRLAADAYRVRVVDAPDPRPDGLDGALDRFAAGLADAVADAAGDDGVVAPVVLVGADTGALAIAALLGRAALPPGLAPAAAVLAGPPAATAATDGTWDDELDARTACPTHRGTLTDDTGVRRGTLDTPVPPALAAGIGHTGPDLPVLLLVGDADPLADRAALRRTATTWPRTRLSVVRGAHHDVLNDLQHRSVAAEVVTFLETLRNALVPVVAVESSAW